MPEEAGNALGNGKAGERSGSRGFGNVNEALQAAGGGPRLGGVMEK